MDLIKSFLSKYQDSLDKNLILRVEIQKIIQEILKVEIKKEEIEVKPPVVRLLNLPAPLRSEIFIHQQKILDKITSELGDTLIKEIK